MSRIGSVLMTGTSSGGAWSEVQDCHGTELRDLSTAGTAVTFSGGVPSLISLTNRSITASHHANAPGGISQASRIVHFNHLAESPDFAVASTDLGKVYFAGRGVSGSPIEGGSVGSAGKGIDSFQAVQIPSLEGVVSVAAGNVHCLALRADGSVFSWGRNDSGQLGLGPTSENGRKVASVDMKNKTGATFFVGTPRYISCLHRTRITSIACGSRHSLLVADDGALYSFGENLAGQLGVGRSSMSSSPVRVMLSSTMPTKSLAATVRLLSSSSPKTDVVALDTTSAFDVDTYSSNENKEGKDEPLTEPLSIPEDDSDVVRFDSSTVDVRAVSASGGLGHSLVLTASGHVFSFGLNNYGQLGLGDINKRFTPALVFVIDRDTEGLSYQGIGEEEDIERQVEAYNKQQGSHLKPLIAQQLSAGPYHSVFLATAKEGGGVYTCGSSSSGRLGQSHLSDPAASAVAHVSMLVQMQKQTRGTLDGDSIDGTLTVDAALEPQHPDHKWPFPTGVGPLALPFPTHPQTSLNKISEYTPPISYLKNLERDVRPQPAKTFDEVTQRPATSLVTAGTWTIPLVRTSSHRRMIDAGEKFILAAATGQFQPHADPVEERRMTVEAMKELTKFKETAAMRAVNKRFTPGVRGMPWKRGVRPANLDAPITVPGLLRSSILNGRVITRVSATDEETILFAPAILKRAVPHACPDFGGSLVTLTGPGLNSISKAPEATLLSKLSVAESERTAAAAVRLFAPRKDATGMHAIAGVFVRWMCRFDKSLAGMSREVRPAVHDVEVHYSRAYYAVGADLEGFLGLNDAKLPFRVRLDGSTFPSSTDELHLDLDSIRTIAPAVSRPCEAEVQLMVIDPEKGEAALRSAPLDAFVHGSLRFSFFAQPEMFAVSPTTVSVSANDELTITGDNLFGVALVDTTARPIAEKLIIEVQKEVNEREIAEAERLAAQLSKIDLKTGKFVAPSSLPPLIHVSRPAGSTDELCEILVSFDLFIDGTFTSRVSPISAFYHVKYDEHIVDVRAASRAIAAAQTGIRLPSGTTAPVSTPQSSTTRVSLSAATSAAVAVSVDSKTTDDADKGIVGTYSAVIKCNVPDVKSLFPKSFTKIPSIPEELHKAVKVLYSRWENMLVNPPTEEVLVIPGSVQASIDEARSFAFHSRLEGTHPTAISTARIAHLVPRMSVNGGVDWLEGRSSLQITLVDAELSHISPCSLLLPPDLSSTIQFRVRGAGLIPGTTAAALLSRIDSNGALVLEQPFSCSANVINESTLEVTANAGELAKALLPNHENETLCGFFTIDVSISLSGRVVETSHPLRFCICTGGIEPRPEHSDPLFISDAAGEIELVLAKRNAPDCFDGISGLRSDGDLWIPPCLILQDIYNGIISKDAERGSNSVYISIKDQEGHHRVSCELSRRESDGATIVIGKFEPFGLQMHVGPLTASVVIDNHPSNALSTPGYKMFYYSLKALSISAVTCSAKKVCAGAEVTVTIIGLDELIRQCQDISPPSNDIVIRLKSTENASMEAILVPAIISPDKTGVTFVLPEIIGTLSVEFSISGSKPNAFIMAPTQLTTVKK
jgi:alpha-tubulin suppressor-like RCC1 family protein